MVDRIKYNSEQQVGEPSARAKINITGVSWLKRLGEESEIKASMRKKTGDTRGKKFGKGKFSKYMCFLF